MGKMKDYFVDDAVYEDLFATCKNRDEVGKSWDSLGVLVVVVVVGNGLME